MKLVLITLVALFTTQANAVSIERGAFVPQLCSRESDGNRPVPSVVAVSEVCFGSIAGSTQKALQILTNDGAERIYQLDGQFGPARMGSNKFPFSGRNTQADWADTVTGVFSMTSGITVTHGISFRTSGNLSFTGPLWPARSRR